MIDPQLEQRALPVDKSSIDRLSLSPAPSVICVVDDFYDLVNGLERLFSQRYGAINVEALTQTNESAQQIAQWVLDQGATALVTDHNMLEGTFGVDVLAKIIELDPDRALRMTFIIYTGLAHEARHDLNKLDPQLGPEIVNRITIIEKGADFKLLYPPLDARWQPGT